MADSPRRVTLRVEHRSVTLDTPGLPAAAAGDRLELSYAGLLLTRSHGDTLDAQVWLPMGEHPSYADDEALIAALFQAMRWAGH